MKKNILLGFLFFTVIVSSQRRYAADRYFKEFAYVKAAELYERIYKKGDSSKLVVTRLGDSYYLNLATEKSEFWYKKLFELYAKDTIPAEYYFKLSQSLKSNGKYKESDQWLLKLRDVSKDDSRAKRLVDRANYFSEYTNKEKTFVNIKNLSVNTEYSDFGPFISKNKRYFSSTRPDNTLKRNKLYAWNKQPLQSHLSLFWFQKHLKPLNLYGRSRKSIVSFDYL
jgi:tetratricopeptide (TPR) repeat protein